MKLYLYTLDSKDNLVHREFNVEEKNKTYKVIGSISGIYRSRINKDEIGYLKGNYIKELYLTKRDDVLAARLFSEYYEGVITMHENKIKECKQIINNIHSSL